MYMLLLKDMLSFPGYLRFPTPSFIKNFITLGLEAVSPKKKKKKRLSNLRWVWQYNLFSNIILTLWGLFGKIHFSGPWSSIESPAWSLHFRCARKAMKRDTEHSGDSDAETKQQTKGNSALILCLSSLKKKLLWQVSLSRARGASVLQEVLFRSQVPVACASVLGPLSPLH